jgi:AraC-like DNA-binding protein
MTLASDTSRRLSDRDPVLGATRVAAAAFSDFDAIADAIPDFEGEYVQLEPGVPATTLRRAALDRVVAIQFEEDSPAYAFHTDAPARMTTLVFTMNANASVRLRGIPVTPDHVLVYGGGAEHVGGSRGSLRTSVLHVEADALAAHAESLGVPLDVRERSARVLASSPRRHAALRAAAEELFDATELTNAACDGAALRRALEQAILDAAVAVLGVAAPTVESASVSHHRAVRNAFALLEARVDEPVYLSELCDAAGVSERTLRSAFQTMYGVSPIRFLQAHRMGGARRALLRADPSRDRVSEIAHRFGFANLGRFAGEFRALFGESPSRLLRASR